MKRFSSGETPEQTIALQIPLPADYVPRAHICKVISPGTIWQLLNWGPWLS